MSSEEIVINKILVATDGSDISLKAAKHAIKIAKALKARVVCIHGVGTPAYYTELGQSKMVEEYYKEARRLSSIYLAKIVDLGLKEGIDVKTEIMIDVISVPDAITNYASNEGIDIIVIGTHGRRGMKRLLLGSVANAVVSHAHCPVLVVR